MTVSWPWKLNENLQKLKNTLFFISGLQQKLNLDVSKLVPVQKKSLSFDLFLPILELGGVSPNLKNQNNLIPICSTFQSHSLE